jgi:hypothetical protein
MTVAKLAGGVKRRKAMRNWLATGRPERRVQWTRDFGRGVAT